MSSPLVSLRAATRGPLSALALLVAAACHDSPATPVASRGAMPSASADVTDRMRVRSKLEPAALAASAALGRDVQLVFQQPAVNEYAYWKVHNGGIVAVANYGGVPAEWSLVGGGDITGDGIDDLLWQHTSGTLVRWALTPTDAIGSTVPQLPYYAPPPWRVVATADLNADGNVDLVWQQTNGDVVVWLMNGQNILSSVGLGAAPPPWRVVAAGRVRVGTGTAPVLFWEQPTNGARVAWVLTPNLLGHTTIDYGVVPTNWSLVGYADYDGDGEDDLFWQNPTTAEILVWLMNGTAYRTTVSPGSPPPPWRLRAVRYSGAPVAGGAPPTITSVVAPAGATLIGSNARLGAGTAGTTQGIGFVVTSTSGNPFPGDFMIGTVQVVTPQGTFCATAADLVSAGPFTAGHTLNGVSTTTAPPCPQIAFADVRITPGAANVPNGVYTLSVRARDLAGNLSDPLTRTWEVDAIPPSAIENPLVTTLPLSGGQSESFSGTARDNLSIVDQLALVHYPNSLGGADVLLRYNGSQSSAPLGTFFVPAAPIAVTVPFFVRAIALQPIAGTAFTAVASNAMRAADAIALGASDPGANWTYGSIGGFALDNSAGQASPGTFFGGANQPVNASITYQANNVTTPSAGFSAGAACAAAGGDAAFTLNSASTGCATSVTINLVQNGAAGVPFQSQITNVSLYIRGATPGTPPFGGPTAYTLAGTFGGAFTGVSSATGIQTTTNSFTFVPGASGIPSFPGSAGTTAVDALVVASTANGYAIAFQLPTINLVNP